MFALYLGILFPNYNIVRLIMELYFKFTGLADGNNTELSGARYAVNDTDEHFTNLFLSPSLPVLVVLTVVSGKFRDLLPLG